MPKPTVHLKLRSALSLSTCVALTTIPASAGTSGNLPWEEPIRRIADSLSGPVTQSVLILAIVLLGLGLAFAEGAVLRRLLGLVLGGSVAAAAASLVASFFGVVAGATFP